MLPAFCPACVVCGEENWTDEETCSDECRREAIAEDLAEKQREDAQAAEVA